MTPDYSLFLREEVFGASGWRTLHAYDLFLSAFNLGDRTQSVWDKVSATSKIWLVHNEYGLSADQLPPGERFELAELAELDEAIYCRALIDRLVDSGRLSVTSSKICVDITGMLRPHLMFLILYLKRLGVKSVDVLYAEPQQYALKEKTPFSTGEIASVRPVRGFEGSPSAKGDGDFLVMGMGYDDRLQAAVAEAKEKAEKHQVFGLPSLRADMYQESVLRSRRSADELGDPNFSENHRSFAPANDPFGTAAVIQEIVVRKLAIDPRISVLLCPLGTKPQALGFALYHAYEGESIGARIVFPISRGYSPRTGTGLARAWLYRIEF